MRPSRAALAIAILAISFWQSSPALWSSDAQTAPAIPAPTIYDPNPGQLWNRLHAAIFIRANVTSTARVPDALDPPLWPHSPYLLSQPSHERFLKILDEFLQTHGERLIQDPVKRAMLERDLWWVFDWSVEREPNRPNEPAYDKERQELQSRLAEVLRRLALTPALDSCTAFQLRAGRGLGTICQGVRSRPSRSPISSRFIQSNRPVGSNLR